MTILQEALAQRLTEALAAPLPSLTRRDARLPAIPGKAFAVIGVRRAGKTSYLWQCLHDRLAAGRPRESLVLLGLEDDRLAGLTTADLDWLLEEYFRRYPAFRGTMNVTLYLDEIQNVTGWERFARRVMDTEKVTLVLSGSSARLLSREVATSLRGRGLEVLLHPFSFREALRHADAEPERAWSRLGSAGRSLLDHRLRQYLAAGGFPEAQGLDTADRATLLRGYVDVAVLRDVIERHGVSNPHALRWLQRQLLANPGGSFSVQRFYLDLRSQGLPVAKDTLHDYLAFLEDSFLVRTVSLHTRSERRRMVNPRKAYPVDPALTALYSRTGEPEVGHALETAVQLELERRGYETSYVRTREGWEVDFLATAPGRKALLVQVCATLGTDETMLREMRALQAARSQHRNAVAMLVTLDAVPPRIELPAGVSWWPATRWLLESPDESE